MTDTTPEIIVTKAPPLITVPAVELMHTGQWPISTGIANFTPGDLQNAVAALACPAVRRPVLKLGHAEPDPDEQGMRWDGEPAVGYITNMAVVENGQTLIGDYAGMPSWLGNGVLASAYPDRSIEGQYDFRCQIGHTHPFVVTAVALLGVVPPGIGTLQSLQDVAALYGVTDPAPELVAAAADPAPGPSFTLTVHAARQEAFMPNPNPAQVRAGVTTDDVRRAFYDSDYGRGYDTWICEIQLGPTTQLIVIDDSSGKLQRVPVTISDGDGENGVEFGEPVPVVVRYEDAQVAATAGLQVVAYASRDESRPEQAQADAGTDGAPPVPGREARNGDDPAAASTRPEAQDSPPDRAGANTDQEGAAMDAAKLREALGLSPEASDDEVRAALTDQGVTPAQPTDPALEPESDPDDGAEGSDDDGDGGEGEDTPAGQPAPELVSAKATSLPPGTVAIDETTLQQLRRDAREGVAARAQQKREARDRALDDAIRAGKFPPVRREHWATYWDRDEEGAKAAIADLAEGLVPVKDAGEPGGELTTEAVDAEFDRLFPDSTKARN